MSLLYHELSSYIDAGARGIEAIPAERKAKLSEIARFIEGRLGEGSAPLITFICTQNSRRSLMAQIWAQTAAAFCEVPKVQTFSGGMEATSFHPSAVAALRRAGLRIDKTEGEENPVYHVRYSDRPAVMEVFSKLYNSPPNPREDFCAVLTCSDADADCPVVLGSSQRVTIPYDDPKAFDGTGREALEYDERCRQISSEMLHLFSLVRYE
jgi:arsenate reductase